MCTYIHVQHSPIELLPRCRLPLRIPILLQRSLLPFPLGIVNFALPVNSREDVQEPPLERSLVEFFVGRNRTRRVFELYECNPFW